MRNLSVNSIAGLFVTLIVAACASSTSGASPPAPQVLFVCEHGNVKSLMAASYFNRLAVERGLAHRAISRGVAPDSTSVPPAIVAGLRAEGFDVAQFRPLAVSVSEVSASQRVILINTALPAAIPAAGIASEQWTAVPAASADYRAASDALKRHVEKLIDDLNRAPTH
jgi:arsenate reductase (thioredoxin)